MKNGTAYAGKIKKLFNQIKCVKPSPAWPESPDPLEQLMLAVLSEGNNPAKARTALNRIMGHAVDLNDLRVSTPQELAGLIDNTLPDALGRTTALLRVLQSIYERENAVTLEPLEGKGKRDTRSYLESLQGATPYIVACTLLWGYGDPAIAVDDGLIEVLRREELIDPAADIFEVQGFLERHIPAAEAKMFSLVMKRYAAQRSGRGRVAEKARKSVARK